MRCYSTRKKGEGEKVSPQRRILPFPPSPKLRKEPSGNWRCVGRGGGTKEPFYSTGTKAAPPPPLLLQPLVRGGGGGGERGSICDLMDEIMHATAKRNEGGGGAPLNDAKQHSQPFSSTRDMKREYGSFVFVAEGEGALLAVSQKRAVLGRTAGRREGQRPSRAVGSLTCTLGEVGRGANWTQAALRQKAASEATPLIFFPGGGRPILARHDSNSEAWLHVVVWPIIGEPGLAW